MFQSVFEPILERHKVPAEFRIYMMKFYVQGLMAIITEWLKEECQNPVERIMEIMQKCIRFSELEQ